MRAHESYVIIIHSCKFSALHDTQVEVFFEKGKQRLSIHVYRCRSDYFKMYKVGRLHVLKICGYSGSLQWCANRELVYTALSVNVAFMSQCGLLPSITIYHTVFPFPHLPISPILDWVSYLSDEEKIRRYKWILSWKGKMDRRGKRKRHMNRGGQKLLRLEAVFGCRYLHRFHLFSPSPPGFLL